MGNHWYLTLLGLSSLLASFSLCEAQTVCQTPGWFGSSCQYKCHCANDNCDSESGECTSGSLCINGWFGPACQYVDLTFTNSTLATPAWLSDGNDNTCNPDISSTAVTVTLTSSFPVTWLRLHVKNPNSLQRIQYNCADKKTALVDDNTLDLHCDFNGKVSQVVLNGDGVTDLCSVYISGGRYVALKQQTQQTSTYSDPENNPVSSKAVDGNTDGNYVSGSCTHTSTLEHPQWSVSFTQPMIVNRYVLYNRIDKTNLESPDFPFLERLQGFTLSSFNENGVIIFIYHDPETEGKIQYTITTGNEKETSPISNITITTRSNMNILTLCEVEAYGDSICTANPYGRECEHTCNCAIDGEACFVSTGGCPSGCATGFYGEHCSRSCPPGKFGISCNQICSPNCAGGPVCDSKNGHCTDCVGGRYGTHCEKQCSQSCKGDGSCDQHTGSCTDCADDRYGLDCEQHCSQGCTGHGSCDQQTGSCTEGCKDGYIGDLCHDCVDGRYGINCGQNCSQGCEGHGSCDQQTGSCTEGCKDGYTGDICQVQAQTGQSTTDSGLVIGLGVGIGVTIALLVAGAVAVGVYCYCRRTHSTQTARIEPPGYENAGPSGQDEHTYNAIYKSEDGYDLPHDVTSEPVTTASEDDVNYQNVDTRHYKNVTVHVNREGPHGHTGKKGEDTVKKGKDNSGYANY